MSKEDGKEYPCETINDLAQIITPDNFHDVAADLAQWVYLIAAAKATGLQFADIGFIWKDDGIRGVSEVKMATTRPEPEQEEEEP